MLAALRAWSASVPDSLSGRWESCFRSRGQAGRRQAGRDAGTRSQSRRAGRHPGGRESGVLRICPFPSSTSPAMADTLPRASAATALTRMPWRPQPRHCPIIQAPQARRQTVPPARGTKPRCPQAGLPARRLPEAVAGGPAGVFHAAPGIALSGTPAKRAGKRALRRSARLDQEGDPGAVRPSVSSVRLSKCAKPAAMAASGAWASRRWASLRGKPSGLADQAAPDRRRPLPEAPRLPAGHGALPDLRRRPRDPSRR